MYDICELEQWTDTCFQKICRISEIERTHRENLILQIGRNIS